MIESQLERIATALEKLVGFGEARTVESPAQPTIENKEQAKPDKPARKPAAPKPAPVEPPKDTDDDFLKDDEAPAAKVATKEDVIAALTAYGKKPGQSNETARALMKKISGQDKIGKVSEDKYAEIVEAASK